MAIYRYTRCKDKREKIALGYLCKHKNSGFKVGDTVRVLRRADNFENGWGNNWSSIMDNSVNKSLKIERDGGGFGFYLSDGKFYPYFILEECPSVLFIIIDFLGLVFFSLGYFLITMPCSVLYRYAYCINTSFKDVELSKRPPHSLDEIIQNYKDNLTIQEALDIVDKKVEGRE